MRSSANVVLFLTALLLLLAAAAQANADDKTRLRVTCPGGSIEGTRTEFSQSHGLNVVKDRVTFPPISYAIDVPADGQVSITSGSQKVIGVVLRKYPSYRTVVFVFGGVPFMDTLFIKSGVVFSTEHKDLFGAQIATTWKRACRFDE